MITSLDQLKPNQYYTYADYLTWKLQEKVELIKGRILQMAPAPNLKHQKVTGEMFLEIGNFLRKSNCQAFPAPFDVRLPVSSKKGRIDTVVQPDITVICDESKLDEQGCVGAPDLVVEILSPGNTQREMKDKFNIYQESQILEYWLVDPIREFAIIYSLNESKEYIGSRPYTSGDIIHSQALEGFTFDMSLIFNEY